jgi:hypothetical protein
VKSPFISKLRRSHRKDEKGEEGMLAFTVYIKYTLGFGKSEIFLTKKNHGSKFL